MFRVSTVYYRQAYAAYQTDLILVGLLTEAKKAAQTHSLDDFDFSKYVNSDYYECIIVIEEFSTNRSWIFKFPDSNSKDIQTASITTEGFFSGLITAEIQDKRAGLTKTKVMPF
jgi:hypothetical protein